MNIREAIAGVAAGRDLEQAAAAAVMEEIMGGTATPAQIAAFLTALHIKGEQDAEIAGMAAVMQEKATRVTFDGPLVDTCGTGGDGSHSFNISTTAAFVVAGVGLTVAKHGNRAMSSVCGSADVLEALGVNIELDAAGVEHCLREAGIGFMFAPRFHPSMRFAGPVRREIGIRTVFNLLGPLTNPARARHQVLGVASAALAEKLAAALSRMGLQHALVVHGHGGMDELSLSGVNMVYTVRAHQPPAMEALDPITLGLPLADVSHLQGGDAATNAEITRTILQGTDHSVRRDVVLLNAAAAIIAGDRATDFPNALHMARESIDQGHAYARLERLIAASNQ
jgi:anthranilate phosphoribosyltransferase